MKPNATMPGVHNILETPFSLGNGIEIDLLNQSQI